MNKLNIEVVDEMIGNLISQFAIKMEDLNLTNEEIKSIRWDCLFFDTHVVKMRKNGWYTFFDITKNGVSSTIFGSVDISLHDLYTSIPTNIKEYEEYITEYMSCKFEIFYNDLIKLNDITKYREEQEWEETYRAYIRSTKQTN